MLADASERFAPADDDSCLGATEKFVATKANEVEPGGDTGAHQRFGYAPAGKIGQAAGAEIFKDGDAGAAAEFYELGERRLRGESGHAKIRAMHAQQKARGSEEGACE